MFGPAGLHRRLFLKLLGALGVVATGDATTGCAAEDGTSSDDSDLTEESFEYVVVGSGAGGGPLAANLARGGHRVLLLEAGGDHGARPTYQVPVFHGQATEDRNMEWDYFVKHYTDPDRQRQDSKFDEKHGGVWYPRAGTLG